MMSTDPIELRLSIQRALTVNITFAVRGVSVAIHDNQVSLFFYHDGKLTDKIQSDFESAFADIVSDFSSEVYFEEFLIRVDHPYKLPTSGHWMHRRYEKDFNEQIENVLPKLKSTVLDEYSGLETANIPFSKMLRELKLSAQQALLGRVFSTLRSVAVSVSPEKDVICVYMYCDGEITAEIKHLFKMVTEDIRLDFYKTLLNAEEIKFDFHLDRLDTPQAFPFIGDHVYRRDEDE